MAGVRLEQIVKATRQGAVVVAGATPYVFTEGPSPTTPVTATYAFAAGNAAQQVVVIQAAPLQTAAVLELQSSDGSVKHKFLDNGTYVVAGLGLVSAPGSSNDADGAGISASAANGGTVVVGTTGRSGGPLTLTAGSGSAAKAGSGAAGGAGGHVTVNTGVGGAGDGVGVAGTGGTFFVKYNAVSLLEVRPDSTIASYDDQFVVKPDFGTANESVLWLYTYNGDGITITVNETSGILIDSDIAATKPFIISAPQFGIVFNQYAMAITDAFDAQAPSTALGRVYMKTACNEDFTNFGSAIHLSADRGAGSGGIYFGTPAVAEGYIGFNPQSAPADYSQLRVLGRTKVSGSYATYYLLQSDVNCHLSIAQSSMTVHVYDNVGPDYEGGYSIYGLAGAPPLSAANKAKFYYNTADGKIYVSRNAGAYAEVAIGGSLIGATDSASTWRTLLGSGTGSALTTGTYNIAVGYNAMTQVTIGSFNVYVGTQTGNTSRTADKSDNVIIGYQAGLNMGFNKAVLIGTRAGDYAWNGDVPIVAIGYESGHYAGNRSYQSVGAAVMIGYRAGYNYIGAGDLVAIGYQAGYGGGAGAVCVGLNAGLNSTDGNNIFIGYWAMGSSAGQPNFVTGQGNTVIGNETMLANASSNTTLIGWRAGYNAILGGSSVAIGYMSCSSNVNNNLPTNIVAIGASTLGSGMTFGSVSVGFEAASQGGGHNGVSIGYRANRFHANSLAAGSTDNVVIGYEAVSNGAQSTAFSNNVVVGSRAGFNATGAAGETLVGFKSGYNVTTGESNTLYGYQSGDTITTGTKNVCVGYNSDTAANNSSEAIAIGYGVVAATSEIVIGGSSKLMRDADGHFALSATLPSSLSSAFKQMFFTGSTVLIGHGANSYTLLGQNVYLNSSVDPKYKVAGEASAIQQSSGSLYFYNAPSGSADGAISWTQRFKVDVDGNGIFAKTVKWTGEAILVGLGSAPAVSAAGQATMYYNTGDDKIYVSKNGGAYAQLI